jgi:hypothetical protein
VISTVRIRNRSFERSPSFKLAANFSTFFRNSMDRAVAVGNKLCANRVQRERHERHRAKLDRIHADVDNRLPNSYSLPHLKLNYKRGQQMEDRFAEIDRENRILLQRMSEIIRKPSTASFVQPESHKSSSLNRGSRRKELQRITNENMGILKRIERVQPMYDHVKWEHEFRRSRRFLRNKCELPVVLPTGELEEIPSSNTMKRLDSPVLSPEFSSEDNLVLREGHRLGDGFYLIEMYTDDQKGLVISAYSGENLCNMTTVPSLYIDAAHHADLLTEIDHDYTKLLARLRMVSRKHRVDELILQ